MKLHHLALLTTSLLLLSNCSKAIDKEVVVEKEYVKQNIPLQEPPRAVEFPDSEWFVVSEENLDEALAKIKEEGGSVTFMAITPKGYENLAIGVNDLRRYILQQKEIIAYYEKAITGDTKEPEKK
jgi:hypothetical protein